MCLLASHTIAGTGLKHPKPAKNLLQILIEELPEHGGWPDSNRELNAVQDKDCEIKFHYSGNLLKFELNNKAFWGSDSPNSWLENDIPGSNFGAESLASDYATAIITRYHYETALAFVRSHEGATINNLQVVDGHLKCEFTAVQPVEYINVNCTMDNADGWIYWAGGKIPVGKKALVDLKFRDSVEYKEVDAGDFYWPHTNSLSDIIAYRLHQPQEASLLDDLAEREVETRETIAKATDDLNECIGQEQPSKDDLIRDVLMDMAANDVNMPLREAYELADTLITLGYLKQ